MTPVSRYVWESAMVMDWAREDTVTSLVAGGECDYFKG